MKFCSKARVSPKCAFSVDGSFVPDNWSCCIMTQLRYICMRDAHDDDEPPSAGVFSWRDDESAGSIGVIHFGDGYLVMTWYKNRGRTGDAFVVSDGERFELTQERALQIVKQRENLF